MNLAGISQASSSTSLHAVSLNKINELDQKIQKKTTGIFGVLYKLFAVGKDEVKAMRVEKYETFKQLLQSPISQETVGKVTEHIEKEISRLKGKTGTVSAKNQKIITAHELLLRQSTIGFSKITTFTQETGAPSDSAIFRKGHTTDGDFQFSLPVGKKTLLLQGAGVNEKGTLKAMGGFGRVYFGQDGDKQVAVKVIKIFEPTKDEVLNEVDILLKMQGNEHIMGASEVVYITEEGELEPSYVCIVMNRVDGDGLDKLDQSTAAVTDLDKANTSKISSYEMGNKIINALRDAALGLDDLHKLGIIHRDIKPDNVLVDNATGKAFLIDLGLCQSVAQKANNNAGTEEYYSPELSKAQKEGFIRQNGASDIYAFGIMIHKVLSGSPIDKNPNFSRTKDFTSNPADYKAVPESLRKEVADLIDACLKEQPDQRINSKRLAEKLNEIAKKMETLP